MIFHPFVFQIRLDAISKALSGETRQKVLNKIGAVHTRMWPRQADMMLLLVMVMVMVAMVMVIRTSNSFT